MFIKLLLAVSLICVAHAKMTPYAMHNVWFSARLQAEYDWEATKDLITERIHSLEDSGLYPNNRVVNAERAFDSKFKQDIQEWDDNIDDLFGLESKLAHSHIMLLTADQENELTGQLATAKQYTQLNIKNAYQKWNDKVQAIIDMKNK